MYTEPNIVLRRKHLNKTKSVVIFHRNNLSFKDFRKTDCGYIFEERFNLYEADGSLKVIVASNHLYDAFEVDTKDVKIEGKGVQGYLSIFLRFDDQRYLPLDKVGSMGCISYELHCGGNKEICYNKRKEEPHKRKKHKVGANLAYKSSHAYIKIPSSVSWAASHPFQGGGFSPR